MGRSVDQVRAWIWRIRVKIKAVLSRLKVAELEKLSEKLNDRRGPGGIRFLYDYVKKRKNPFGKSMLLRDAQGDPVLSPMRVQEALFKQLDVIFKDNVWPFADQRYIEQGILFNQESIDLMEAEITEQEVQKALTGLRGRKSPGPTDIPLELQKNMPEEMVLDIVAWCNMILDKGELPVQNETSNNNNKSLLLIGRFPPTTYKIISRHRH